MQELRGERATSTLTTMRYVTPRAIGAQSTSFEAADFEIREAGSRNLTVTGLLTAFRR